MVWLVKHGEKKKICRMRIPLKMMKYSVVTSKKDKKRHLNAEEKNIWRSAAKWYQSSISSLFVQSFWYINFFFVRNVFLHSNNVFIEIVFFSVSFGHKKYNWVALGIKLHAKRTTGVKRKMYGKNDEELHLTATNLSQTECVGIV